MKTLKRSLFCLIIILLVFIAVFFVGKVIFHTLFPSKYNEIIMENCESNEIDPYLVYALIKAESNFVPDAKSTKGATGLMQITDSTALWIASKNDYKDFDIENLKEPDTNIKMGCWYLKYLLDLYAENEELALCAYNAGQGNVNNWLADKAYSNNGMELKLIPFEETRNYIERIFRYKKIYQSLYPNI